METKKIETIKLILSEIPKLERHLEQAFQTKDMDRFASIRKTLRAKEKQFERLIDCQFRKSLRYWCSRSGVTGDFF